MRGSWPRCRADRAATSTRIGSSSPRQSGLVGSFLLFGDGAPIVALLDPTPCPLAQFARAAGACSRCTTAAENASGPSATASSCPGDNSRPRTRAGWTPPHAHRHRLQDLQARPPTPPHRRDIHRHSRESKGARLALCRSPSPPPSLPARGPSGVGSRPTIVSAACGWLARMRGQDLGAKTSTPRPRSADSPSAR